MHFIFKSTVKRNFSQQHKATDKMAHSYVAKCISLQLKWAHYLQQKTEQLSRRVKKYALLLFCGFAGGGSLYLTLHSFTTPNSNAFFLTPIKFPGLIDKPTETNLPTSICITKEEFQKIEGFRNYIDNLSKTVAGTKVKNSILQSRPGLMDSVRVIENLYESQTSK